MAEYTSRIIGMALIKKSVDNTDLTALTACPECDLLVYKKLVPVGGKAKCPRCSCQLYTNKPDAVDRTLAFAITGLILFFPANYYPLLTLDFVGRLQDGTVFSGVVELFREDMWVVGTLVFLCAIVVPFVKLLLITFILLCLKVDYRPRGLIVLFRIHQSIAAYGMPEVFLLGVLLSCLKLIDDADIIFRSGFYSYIGLMIAALMVSASLDEGDLWHRLDHSLYDEK